MDNSSAHCDYRSLFPHWGSSPWPPTQGQIKGKFKFPALWADPSYLQLYRKKKSLCVPLGRMFILKAWLWVSEAPRSNRTTDLCKVTTFNAIIPGCSVFWGCKGEVAQRGESDANSTPNSRPMCLNMVVNKEYMTWNYFCQSHKLIKNMHWEAYMGFLLIGIFLSICLSTFSPLPPTSHVSSERMVPCVPPSPWWLQYLAHSGCVVNSGWINRCREKTRRNE